MRYVKKICSLAFEIELNRFYLWMVVQDTTSKIRQYLGVTLTIFDENALDWRELDVKSAED